MGEDIETITEIRKYSDGLVAYKNQNGLWGFLDEYGRVVIEPKFVNVGDFNNGIAYAEVDIGYPESYDKIFINKKGYQISKRSYTATEHIIGRFGFSTSYSEINRVSKYCLTDTFGNYILPLKRIESNALRKGDNLSSIKDKLKAFGSIIIFYGKRYTINHSNYGKTVKEIPFNIKEQYAVMDNYDLNPVDKNIYAIVSVLDSYGFTDCIVDIYGNIVLRLQNYNIQRLNNKYFICNKKYKVGSEVNGVMLGKTAILYVDARKEDKISVVFNSNIKYDDVRVVDDNNFILVDNLNKKRIFNVSKGELVDSYNDIIYSDDSNYIIGVIVDVIADLTTGKTKQKISYNYISKDCTTSMLSTNYIDIHNGIGICKEKEKAEISNSIYTYNKYYIYDSNLNPITTFPNDEYNIVFKDLQHVGDLLVGKLLFTDKYYVIDPKHTDNSIKGFELDCDSYEYYNGYFITVKDGKYSLINKDGILLLDDYSGIYNIGDNKLLLKNGIENNILFLDKINNLEVLDYARDTDGCCCIECDKRYNSEGRYTFDILYIDYLLHCFDNLETKGSTLIPIREAKTYSSELFNISSTYNPTLPVQYSMILINKKDLLHKIKIKESDLIISLDINDPVNDDVRNVLSSHLDSFPQFKNYRGIRDKRYLKYLKYFDLSNINFKGVDLSGVDLSETNINLEDNNLLQRRKL